MTTLKEYIGDLYDSDNKPRTEGMNLEGEMRDD